MLEQTHSHTTHEHLGLNSTLLGSGLVREVVQGGSGGRFRAVQGGSGRFGAVQGFSINLIFKPKAGAAFFECDVHCALFRWFRVLAV